MAGRKTVRTPETEVKLTEAFQRGATEKLACAHAGIDVSTFSRWRAADADFASRIARTRSKNALDVLTRINNAGSKGNVNADMWYLEHVFQEDYGTRLIIKLDASDAAILKKHGLTASEAWQLLMQRLAN